MAPALRNKVIALAGDFGAKRTTADLKRWIEAAGGELSSSVSARVTHLVCSKEAWKNKNAVVKSALKQKKTKIVSYDWLEDSCMKKSRQYETKYLWKSLDDEKAKKKTERKEATKTYIKEKKVDNHHYYRDSTGFLYNIVLINPDRPNGMMPHYCLRLYETNTRPHQYAVTLSHHLTPPSTSSTSNSPFSTSHSTPSPMIPTTTTTTKPANILTPMGSPYHIAYATFRHAFRKLTNVDWDFRIWSVPNYRVESRSPPPRSRSSSPEQHQPNRIRKKDLPKANADSSSTANNEPLMDGVVRAPGNAPFALDIPARIAAQKEADRTIALIGGWGVRAVDQAIEEGEIALSRAVNAAAAGGLTAVTTKPVVDEQVLAGMLDPLKSELERDRRALVPPSTHPQPMRTTTMPGLGVGAYQSGGGGGGGGEQASNNNTELPASFRPKPPSPPPVLSSSSNNNSTTRDPFGRWRKFRPSLEYKPSRGRRMGGVWPPVPPPQPAPAPLTIHQQYPTQHQPHPNKKQKTEKHYHTYALPISARAEPLGELGMRETGREWFGDEGTAGWRAWKAAAEDAGVGVDAGGNGQGNGKGNGQGNGQGTGHGKVRVRVGGGIKD